MRRLFFFLLLFLFPVATHAASCATDTGSAFAYYKATTIQATQVPSSQSNFPALAAFIVADADFATVANGGHVQSSSGFDICPFSNSSLTTPLTYELVTYNATTGAFEMWVKMTAVNGGVVYFGHGDSSITTNASSASTWDTNYKAVYHFKDGTTLSTADSTSNANNATNHSTTATSGKVDGGAAFGGTEYLTTSFSTLNTTHTFEFWINRSNSLYLFDTQAGRLIIDTGFNGTANNLSFYNSIDGWQSLGVVASGSWVQIALTLDSGGNVSKGYVNGALIGTGVYGGVGIGGCCVNIGSDIDGLTNFAGSMDEFRWTNGLVRSADWIATEYNNQSAPSSFWSIGAETPTSIVSSCPKSGLTLLGVGCGAD